MPFLLAALLALLLAAPASASVRTFGSSLSAPADKSFAHPVDTAFWASKIAGGRAVRSPASGQVLSIRLKGVAIRNGNTDPDARVHFQTLHKRRNGTYRIIVTSGTFNVPFRGDPQQISTFRPVNMCVKKGDRIAFNTVGGFVPDSYPSGTPLQVFARVSGSATAVFSNAGKTNNGDVMRGRNRSNTELLMQVRVGSGRDGTGLCPGGTKT